MAYTIPDKGEGVDNVQSIQWQEDIEIMRDGLAGIDCVLSGCEVTGGSDMTPEVAKGAVLSNRVLRAVAAGTFTIGAADATNPRIDLCVIDSSGAKQTRAGTAAAAPKPPNRTANDVVLAMVYVPANDTTIATAQCIDKRVFPLRPVKIAHTSANVSSTNTNGATTFVSVTLPDGLLLSGEKVRLRAAGVYQTNAAALLTLNIAYGGTALFTDSSANTTNTNVNQGAWDVDVIVNAAADNAQTMGGLVAVQTPSANKTAPTAGAAGDMAVLTHVACPVAGTAAVNSNNANQTLLLTWAMNINNANTLLRQYWSILELM